MSRRQVPRSRPGGTPANPRRWLALAYLTLIHATLQIDRNVISVVVEPIKREFHLSDAAMGALSGIAHSGAFALLVLPLGFLADRVNRIRMIAIVVCLWGSLTAMTALARSQVDLFIMRIGVGAAEAGGPPAMLSTLADLFPDKRRPTAMGIYAGANALGTGAIFAIGGIVAHQYGWRMAFLIAGLPAIILSLMLLLSIREPARALPAPVAGVSRRGFRRDARAMLGNRSLVLTVIGGTLASSAQHSVITWMGSFFIRAHGLSLSEAGLVVAASLLIGKGLGTVLSGPFTAWLSGDDPARYWRYTSLTLCASVPLGWTMLGLQDTNTAIAAAVVLGFLLGAWPGQAMTILLAGAPVALRGSSVAMYQCAVNFIGIGFGPLLAGLLSDAFGPEGLGPAIGCALTINILAAAAFMAACRRLAPSRGSDVPTPA